MEPLFFTFGLLGVTHTYDVTIITETINEISLHNLNYTGFN